MGAPNFIFVFAIKRLMRREKATKDIRLSRTVSARVKESIISSENFKINFLINYYASKPKYLSVGSFEIQRYKKLYPKDAELFLSYNHNNSKKIKIFFINYQFYL